MYKLRRYFSNYFNDRVMPNENNFNNRFQEKMLEKQASYLRGINFFIIHSSYWNNNPKLPEDIKRIIHGFATKDLNNTIWCEHCINPVMKKKKKRFIQESPYTRMNNKFICMKCSESQNI